MTTWDEEHSTRMKGPSAIIWITGAVVILFIVWARFAWVDEIVRAEAGIVSAARPQIVQNLEGGILAELLVSEGDVVEEGDVLARLRDTQFRASADDISGQIEALEVRRIRIEAEIAGQSTFVLPPEFAGADPEIVASEQALLAARQADYISRTEGAMQIVEETRRELAVMEDLYTREIAALIEVTRARKANSDAEIRHNEVVTTAELERANEYSEVLQQLATLRQELRLAQDQLERTVVLSPMRGVVNSVGVATIGGVIRPGEEMFTIIPADDELLVEARVRPQDIANVLVGQQATIKLAAYDYTIYGTIPAEVVLVSADTFPDERRADLPPHYKVMLRMDLSALTDRQDGIELRPGMMATVELYTGEKTILSYLTKPLYRGSEALREP